MGTWSFRGVESGRGVTLTPHPLLVPKYKNRVELLPLHSLRAFVAYKKGETYLSDGQYGPGTNKICCGLRQYGVSFDLITF
jgi:hypothetical protein